GTREALRWRTVDRLGDGVVEAEEREVELRDDDILVVTRIADQRATPRRVGVRDARQIELPIVDRLHAKADAVRFVEKGLVNRTAAVEGVEIEARRAEIVQRIGIVAPLQTRGRIEG